MKIFQKNFFENEAYLSIQDNPDDYEIVTPSISILAQPSVAVVDSVVDKRGTREAVTEYLSYLYSDDSQRLAGKVTEIKCTVLADTPNAFPVSSL